MCRSLPRLPFCWLRKVCAACRALPAGASSSLSLAELVQVELEPDSEELLLLLPPRQISSGSAATGTKLLGAAQE